MNERFARAAVIARVDLAHEADFTLGAIEVRPVQRQIVAAGSIETVEPRVMRVLVALARAKGTAMSRDDLIESCWDGVIVGDDAINRCIGRLRKAAEASGNAFSIETLPRVGYRLVVAKAAAAGPESADDAAGPPDADARPEQASPARRFAFSWRAAMGVTVLLAIVVAGSGLWWLRTIPAPALSDPPASVAVLPFANMSGDPARDYFSDGFSDELLNDLSGDSRLLVAARTSAYAFRGRNGDIAAVARALHVHAIVEGSVRQAGSRVRIDVQLIDAGNGYNIWSARYDRNVADILNVQDEVAHAVAFALTPRLLSNAAPAKIPTRAPIDPDAYQKYLVARSMLEKRTNDGDANASRLFKEVTDVEPDFAPAYAGLGRTYVHMAQFHAQRPDILAAAEASLKTALRLDPRNLEALSEHLLLALMKWDWQQAAHDAHNLQALNAHSTFTLRALGLYYGSLGFLEQQSVALREATRLDPLSFVDMNNIAVVYENRGEHVEAASAASDALALRPDRPLALSTLCSAYVGMKRTKDAEGLIARLLVLHEPDASRGCALMLAASAGRIGEAHATADVIASRFPTFVFSEADIGIFYLAANDTAGALAWFERAYDKRDYNLFAFSRFATTPAAFLRTPGWVALMRRPEAKAWQVAHDRLATELSPTN